MLFGGLFDLLFGDGALRNLVSYVIELIWAKLRIVFSFIRIF